MEELILLSCGLVESLKEINDEKAKEDLILSHLHDNEKSAGLSVDFHTGQSWFNTTTPLTIHKDLKGKIVVIDFFTYCCINCIHILPHLKVLERNFSVEDGIVVVGVHSAKFDNEKSTSNIAAALQKYEISHPVVNDSECVLWTRLGVSCWPTVLILGPSSQPLFVLVGEFDCHLLQLFVHCAAQHFSTSLSHLPLPMIQPQGSKLVTSSPVLFPGKLATWGHLLAVSDTGHHRVVVINIRTGQIEVCAGGSTSGFQDGSFKTALFNSPQGVTFLDQHTLYIADTENHAVRMLCLKTLAVSTLVGTGQQGFDMEGGERGPQQVISSPWDLCFVPASHVVLPPASAFMSMAAPLPWSTQSVQGPPSLPAVAPPPPPLPAVAPPPPPPPVPFGSKSASHNNNNNKQDSKVLLIAMSGTHQIWAYFLQDTIWWKGRKYKQGTCAAVAGSGKEENRNSKYPHAAAFSQPSGLSYSSKHQSVIIADSESSSIRRLSLADGAVSAVAGGGVSPINLFSFGEVDGVGHDAKLQHPLGVACSSTCPDLVYVVDTYNHKLRSVLLTNGQCTTLNLPQAVFSEPSGVCCGEDGVIYVADTNNHTVKMVRVEAEQCTMEVLSIKGHIEDGPEDKTPRDTTLLETTINPRGGLLEIHVFLPPHTHGKWQVSNCGHCVAELRTGSINSEEVYIRFKVPEGGSERLQVLLDLVLCGETACEFKKCALDVDVSRSNAAPNSVQVNVSLLTV